MDEWQSYPHFILVSVCVCVLVFAIQEIVGRESDVTLLGRNWITSNY